MPEPTYTVTLTQTQALAIGACVEACCLGPNPVGNIAPAEQQAAIDGMAAISGEMMKDVYVMTDTKHDFSLRAKLWIFGITWFCVGMAFQMFLISFTWQRCHHA